MNRRKMLLLGLGLFASSAVGCMSMMMGAPAAPIARPSDLSPASVNVSGVWKGYATVGANYQLPYTLTLEQKRSDVTGTIEMSTRDFTRRAVYEIEGVVSGKTLYYKGTGFTKRVQGFCMTTAKLNRQSEGGAISLVGDYGPLVHPDGCPLYESSTGQVNVELQK